MSYHQGPDAFSVDLDATPSLDRGRSHLRISERQPGLVKYDIKVSEDVGIHKITVSAKKT